MPSRRRLLLLAAGGALVLAGGGAAALLAVVPADRVARGVHAGPVDLSGLSRSDAEQAVSRAYAASVAAPVEVVAADASAHLDPAQAGLRLDAAATVDAALRADVQARVRGLLGARRDVLPVIRADRERLQRALAGLAQQVDKAPREGLITFDGVKPVTTDPVEGRRLDVAAAADAVARDWPGVARVQAPVRPVPARTTAADVQTAVREVATPAVSAPVTIRGERGSFSIPPASIAASLRVAAGDDSRLRPVVDPAVLLQKTAAARRPVEEPAVDATFDTRSGRPVVVPGRPGRGFGGDDLARAVEGLVAQPAPRAASVPFTATQPRVTTERAQNLGVVEQVSSFTTQFPCCAPRVTNITRIAQIVDGYVLLPGETFDLNAYVGPRDTARGFVPAPQILDGEFSDAVGGGISQFATTLFNAVFFAGLEDVTHTPHSYYISRYPPGREATVSYPQPELVFRNDSPNGILIRAATTGTSVTVSFWGTKRFDVQALQGPRTRVTTAPPRYITRPGCIPGPGEAGFDIVVTRVFRQGGREVRRQTFFTRYQAEPQFVCGPPPA